MLGNFDIFTDTNFNALSTAGAYTDHAGGTFYEWALAPAKDTDNNSMYANKELVENAGFGTAFATMRITYAYFKQETWHNIPRGYFSWFTYYGDTGISYLEQQMGDVVNRDSKAHLFNRPNSSTENIEWHGCTTTAGTIVLHSTNGNAPIILNYETMVYLQGLGVDAPYLTFDSADYEITGFYRPFNTVNENTIEGIGRTYYNDGFNAGKAEGIATANGTSTGFDLFGQTFTAVGNWFGTEVLPGISIGTLFIVPVLVTLMITVIRILKK